jgi:hypothetical protein
MAQLAPPKPPPRVALGDDDRLARLHFRLWQVMMTALTVLVCGWFVTLGPIPAIISLMVAKHVLVAILMVGLDMRPVRAGEGDRRFPGY